MQFPSGHPVSTSATRRPMLTAQLLAVAAMLLGALGLNATPASAQETVTRHISASNAIAEGTICLDDPAIGCASLNLIVSPGKVEGTTVACLAITGDAFSDEACADVTSTFSMDTRHLSSAELPPTPITFETAECDKSGNCSEPVIRTFALAASWTGIGNRTPIHEIQGDPHQPCSEYHIFNGFVRDATVALNIDGLAADATGNLQHINVHQIVRTSCR